MWWSENVKKGSEVVGVIAEAPMEVDMELDGARFGCGGVGGH